MLNIVTVMALSSIPYPMLRYLSTGNSRMLTATCGPTLTSWRKVILVSLEQKGLARRQEKGQINFTTATMALARCRKERSTKYRQPIAAGQRGIYPVFCVERQEKLHEMAGVS